MNDTGDSSGKDWRPTVALFIAVPAALVALLVLWDRVTDNHSAPTSTTQTSAPSTPPDTVTSNEPTTSPPPSTDVPNPQQSSTDSAPNTQRQPPSTTTQAPPPIPVVDHIQISTWAYDKAGLNTYRADNTGGKSIRVSWTASANGYEVNGACASSVRIQGPDTDQAKNASNCSDSMGTYLDVHQPGNYTVTVTTRQDSGAEHSDNITVTVLPG
jgi:hypothetical protein